MDGGFVKALTEWYAAAGRDLPWRKTTDPYRIWISETMLQQTRVETVISYYQRFTEQLPDLKALAGCAEEKLLKLWEGLGYYSRARNLKKAAEMICSEKEGVFPSDYKELIRLPGIGPYTAGAVASIAFGLRAPAVDGNVLRVWARLTGLRENILQPGVRKKIEAEVLSAMQFLPEQKQNWETQEENAAGSFNQALIELGALICVPNRAPLCEECPVRTYCKAYRMALTAELPVRLKEKRIRREKRTVLLVRTPDGIALKKRPSSGLLAGLYEYPNTSGHLSPEEVVAYVKENGYDALRVTPLPDSKHLFSHLEWQMIGYEVRISQPDEEREQTKWIIADLNQIEHKYPIPSAFRAYSERLGYEGR